MIQISSMILETNSRWLSPRFPRRSNTRPLLQFTKNRSPLVRLALLLASPNIIDSRNQALADVAVIGAAALDITSQEFPNVDTSLGVHSTAPGSIKISLGGVARNIAEATHRVMAAKFPGLSSVLVAPVGYDAFGHILVDKLHAFGMRTDGIIRTDTQSAVCNMVLDSNGALVRGIADMGINESVNSEEVSETGAFIFKKPINL